MRRLLLVYDVADRYLIVGSVLCNVVRIVLGHGRLMEPPSRSSMWRLGYNTPHNYQDNELFCGGFQACIICFVYFSLSFYFVKTNPSDPGDFTCNIELDAIEELSQKLIFCKSIHLGKLIFPNVINYFVFRTSGAPMMASVEYVATPGRDPAKTKLAGNTRWESSPGSTKPTPRYLSLWK